LFFLVYDVVDTGDAFPRCRGTPKPILSKANLVDRGNQVAYESKDKEQASESSNEESASQSDNLESNVNAANEHVPDFNDWAIVHKPGSKFHGHPCHMKGLMDSDRRRANIYIHSNGEYHAHPCNEVHYKQCRLMSKQEIERLRSTLGEFTVVFCCNMIIYLHLVSRQRFPTVAG
jgi:hypothetical protein